VKTRRSKAGQAQYGGFDRANPEVKDGEQFIRHTRALLESAAWAALSLAARRILDRLEVEHMAHGGKQNGRLKVSFTQLAAHLGVRRRNTVATALRELEAVHLVEISRSGYREAIKGRETNAYRLTYLRAHTGGAGHEWRQHDPKPGDDSLEAFHKARENALKLTAEARREVFSKSNLKKFLGTGVRTNSGRHARPENAPSRDATPVQYGLDATPVQTSISRVRRGQLQ
jgi:hypothetical protein